MYDVLCPAVAANNIPTVSGPRQPQLLSQALHQSEFNPIRELDPLPKRVSNSARARKHALGCDGNSFSLRPAFLGNRSLLAWVF